jgi:hypothetical protein
LSGSQTRDEFWLSETKRSTTFEKYEHPRRIARLDYGPDGLNSAFNLHNIACRQRSHLYFFRHILSTAED